MRQVLHDGRLLEVRTSRTMTAQIADTFALEGAGGHFQVSGINGEGLFEPAVHGLRPVAAHTACYRGWFAEYGLQGDRLVLTQLALYLDPRDELELRRGRGVSLGGVLPSKHRVRFTRRGGEELEEDSSEWFYDRLSLPVPFSGGLLLARDFLDELYVHMGFHPAWKFREVMELTFDAGRLVSRVDRSTQMAELRDRLTEQRKGGRTPSEEEVQRWIEASFSRRY